VTTSTTTAFRADTVRQVAKLMATAVHHGAEVRRAALPRRQTPLIETVIVDDRDTLGRLARWMRVRADQRREATWFRI
jgi:hypothetical protein